MGRREEQQKLLRGQEAVKPDERTEGYAHRFEDGKNRIVEVTDDEFADFDQMLEEVEKKTVVF